jgi:hypothetical protein
VVSDEGVKQRLVVVLQVAHQVVLAEGCVAIVQRLLAAFALVFKSSYMGRQQAVQREGIAFAFRECGAFVEAGIQQ